MTVKELILLLETFPQDATVLADDGTGWLAHVEKESIYLDEFESMYEPVQKMVVIGTGDENV